MSPEQFQHFLEDNRRSTAEAIREIVPSVVKETVNGKIDNLKVTLETHIETHDAFMEEVKPILQTFQGGKLVGETIKWVAGVGIAFLAIKGFWK